MYTFIILVIIGFIASACIYKGKMHRHQFGIGVIIFGIVFIGSIVVNGIFGLRLPMTQEICREGKTKLQSSKIITPRNTIEFSSYVQFVYKEIKPGKVKTRFISYYNTINNFVTMKNIRIEFLTKGDSISRYEVWRGVRHSNNKWISDFALPKGDRIRVLYIPNDSIHQLLMKELKDKFYDKPKTANVN
jgi:hypothetical protein